MSKSIEERVKEILYYSTDDITEDHIKDLIAQAEKEARIDEVSHYTANNRDCYDHIGDVYRAAKTRLAQLRKDSNE